MKNQVSPDDKKERSRIIREISAEKRAAFLKSQIGKPLIGIVVQPVKTDTSAMEVLTDNYIKIICTNWPSHIETNSVITVKPVKIIEGNTMSGEIVTLPKSELH
jgi:tRNA A37 methylthiotransferase MiaB